MIGRDGYMIPKKIHYCWFGKGKKSKLALKCIRSWRQYCPEYEVIEWNEENFDIDMNGYTRMCYAEKKYAYLSDYVRLWVVEKYGGIYFDTDVEVIRSLEELLRNDAFFCFENKQYVASGLGFGSVAHGKVIQAMLKEYEILLDGKNGVRMCPKLNTQALVALGLKQNGRKQTVCEAVIYPMDVLNPYNSATGKLEKTENTFSIHWYEATWMSKHLKIRGMITRPIHRIFGVDVFQRFRK